MNQQAPEWWAMLGPLPFPHPAGIIAVPHDRARNLDREYTLGPLLLRPGAALFTEWVRSEPITMESVEKIDSWPVLVEGRWPGNALRNTEEPLLKGLDPQSANERQAAMWLHRAACLLSLAWGETWQVRHAPTGMERFPAAVPKSWPPPPMVAGRWRDDDLDPVPSSLPEWVEAGWEALERDVELSVALTFWHQGMILSSVTPSFALVAFTGAIEAMADSAAYKERLGFKLERCPECRNILGAGARFRAAVSLVMPAQQAAEFLKQWKPYSSRSTTAHGHALHGVESIYGSVHMLSMSGQVQGQLGNLTLSEGDPTQAFMWYVLPTVRNIAGTLLRRALGENG
jgi:hypothetical protein